MVLLYIVQCTLSIGNFANLVQCILFILYIAQCILLRYNGYAGKGRRTLGFPTYKGGVVW